MWAWLPASLTPELGRPAEQHNSAMQETGIKVSPPTAATAAIYWGLSRPSLVNFTMEYRRITRK